VILDIVPKAGYDMDFGENHLMKARTEILFRLLEQSLELSIFKETSRAFSL
jgi:hypothetical protein